MIKTIYVVLYNESREQKEIIDSVYSHSSSAELCVADFMKAGYKARYRIMGVQDYYKPKAIRKRN